MKAVILITIMALICQAHADARSHEYEEVSEEDMDETNLDYQMFKNIDANNDRRLTRDEVENYSTEEVKH